MRTWLQGFPLDHQENFPPFHKAQAPFVAVKGRSLGSVLFNFCQHLWWWSISDTVPCICFEFPVHIQFTRRHTAHITAFAHECFSTGDFAQLQAHMQDEVSLLWRGFLHHNTVSFKFLKHWKLPQSLMQYWQHFLTTIWHDASQSARNRWTTEKAVHLKRKLSKFVCSPADHFPYTLTLHCPQQWRELLRRTFLDDRGFTRCASTPVQTLVQIRESVPQWIWEDYKWGLGFAAPLSSGYILPKPTRDFTKARPIVECSRAWPKKLGHALGVALFEILNVVFKDLLRLKDVQQILALIHQAFRSPMFDDMDYELYQTDIAGFYNQVEHHRILHAVSYAVYQFCILQNQTLESCIQTAQ